MSEKNRYVDINGHTREYEIIEQGGMKVSVDYSEELWAERYRPRIVEDLILDNNIINKVNKWIKDGMIDNLLFFSTTGGSGKDSIISVLNNKIESNIVTINTSLYKNVSDVKNMILKAVSTNSTDGNIKWIYLTETGGMSKQATDSLKALIEENSHVRFILTSNDTSNLSEPLLTRFTPVDMNHIDPKSSKELRIKTIKRVMIILKNEGVEFEKEDVVNYVQANFPSYRAIINRLTDNIVDGKFKLISISSANEINDFLKIINDKKFEEMIKKSDTINVPNFLRFMNNNKIVALEDNDNLADFIYELNQLQTSLNNNVAFPSISLGVFASKMMQGNVKFNLDLS